MEENKERKVKCSITHESLVRELGRKHKFIIEKFAKGDNANEADVGSIYFKIGFLSYKKIAWILLKIDENKNGTIRIITDISEISKDTYKKLKRFGEELLKELPQYEVELIRDSIFDENDYKKEKSNTKVIREENKNEDN